MTEAKQKTVEDTVEDKSGAFPPAMHVAPAARRFAIVYSRLPFPMTRANQMTVAHLIEFFAKRGHAIDLYALDNGEPIGAAERAWLDARRRSVRIFKHGTLRSLLGLVRGLLRGNPLQVGWFTNRAQSRAVGEAVAAGTFDIGYSYYIRSAEALKGLGRGPQRANGPATFLAMQLSQSLNTRRMVRHYRNLKELAIYTVESRLVRGFEARIWKEFTRSVLIGEQDVAEIKKKACRECNLPEIDNVVYCSHGVDIERFVPRQDIAVDPATLVFCGVLRTYANVHAITWFADEVWPLVKEARPDARLLIVGRDPRPEVRDLGRRDGIEVTGEVANPADYIARAQLCINPVQAGAGMQNKLIEFLAMAKPVVATSVANEGIGARPGEHLMIADSPAVFAAAIHNLLGNSARAASLGTAARRFVEETWTWEAQFL